jgi:hypothetical protein
MMGDVLTPVSRPLLSSVDDLLDGVVDREPFLTSDSKSGSGFERLTMADGSVRILKHVHIDHDWTMRFNGDVGCKPAQVWAAGLMDAAGDRIDHGVIAVAAGLGRNRWGAAVLMRDMSDELVPAGDALLSVEQHRAFIHDMATLAARTWGWRDDVGLVPLANRLSWFNHASLAVEAERGWPDAVPEIAVGGWARFAERAPADVTAVIDELRHDPSPLVERICEQPLSMIHGDWKLGNLGTAADGRTTLIDWTYAGEGPCCFDLTWYLAVNRARMPESKEEAIEAFASALRDNGVDTSGWFDIQLDLCFLAGTALFGWEKALGDDEELAWWCDRAREGAARL